MSDNQNSLSPVSDEQIQRCLAETHKHVRKVQENLNMFVHDIIQRGANHDNSKFEEPELSIFAENTHKLQQVGYGTPEYEALLVETRPAILHHYSKNRHHPEFHPNGIEDMTLIDLLEMLCDWRAAGERNKDGNIRKSIAVNSARFKMSPQLRTIFENTVKEYFD